jgi:hypothetical protein
MKSLTYKQNNKRSGRKGARAQIVSIAPTPISTLYIPFRLQYSAAAAVSEANITRITLNSLCKLIVTAATSSTAYTVYDAIRIGRIRYWGPPVGSTAVMSYATHEWLDDSNADFVQNSTHSDRGNQQRPAFLSLRTPVKGSASWWISATAAHTNSTSLYRYACSAATVVEVEGCMRLCDSANSLSSTTSGATAGLTYYNYLDNNASAGGAGPMNLQPIGRQIIGQAS